MDYDEEELINDLIEAATEVHGDYNRSEEASLRDAFRKVLKLHLE